MCTHKHKLSGQTQAYHSVQVKETTISTSAPTATTHMPTTINDVLPCVNYWEIAFLGSRLNPIHLLYWIEVSEALACVLHHRKVYYATRAFAVCKHAVLIGSNIQALVGVLVTTQGQGANRNSTNLLGKARVSTVIICYFIEFASKISSSYPRYNNSIGYYLH